MLFRPFKILGGSDFHFFHKQNFIKLKSFKTLYLFSWAPCGLVNVFWKIHLYWYSAGLYSSPYCTPFGFEGRTYIEWALASWHLLKKKILFMFLISYFRSLSLASPAMQEIRKRSNIQYLEKWEIFFEFCFFISCLVIIWAKSNWNHCRQVFSTGFCPNCNQTADR